MTGLCGIPLHLTAPAYRLYEVEWARSSSVHPSRPAGSCEESVGISCWQFCWYVLGPASSFPICLRVTMVYLRGPLVILWSLYTSPLFGDALHLGVAGSCLLCRHDAEDSHWASAEHRQALRLMVSQRGAWVSVRSCKQSLIQPCRYPSGQLFWVTSLCGSGVGLEDLIVIVIIFPI